MNELWAIPCLSIPRTVSLQPNKPILFSKRWSNVFWVLIWRAAHSNLCMWFASVITDQGPHIWPLPAHWGSRSCGWECHLNGWNGNWIRWNLQEMGQYEHEQNPIYNFWFISHPHDLRVYVKILPLQFLGWWIRGILWEFYCLGLIII